MSYQHQCKLLLNVSQLLHSIKFVRFYENAETLQCFPHHLAPVSFLEKSSKIHLCAHMFCSHLLYISN